MVQEPFPDPDPDPGHDGDEADSFPLPPVAEEAGPAGEDGPGLGHGLYVCLPPEQVTLAGSRRTGRPTRWRPARCWPPS